MPPPNLPANPPVPAGSLAECPRCGEHWPAASPYCSNCGWLPGEPIALDAKRLAGSRVADEGEASVWTEVALPPSQSTPGRSAAPWLLGGLGLAALLGLALWRAMPASAPPPPKVAVRAVALLAGPVPEPASAAGKPASAGAGAADRASAPAGTAAASIPVSPASASASASAAAPSPTASAAAIAHGGPEVEDFVRDWLAAEAQIAAAPEGIKRLQRFYAPAVTYHGQAGMGWTSVAAEKTAFARRWPVRQYESLQLERLGEPGTPERVALRFRWRLESQGRWRSGVSTVLLTLDRADGRLRIVGEQAR